ncbi:MAG: carbonic anhydrase [Deltaproteobacteria bacterium]|nr:MAG: carbonic anhydrase [Deltaproteobacteria bacterium]
MDLEKLLDNNFSWVENKDPEFFISISKGQSPSFLWIGCGDSRGCPNTITGCDLGEIFVNRNVANQVRSDDLNLMASLQFTVEVLKVKNIIVCGHYACGGVNASFNADNGLSSVDNWIQPIRDLIKQNKVELESIDEEVRPNRMVEINVLAQVQNLMQTETIKKAWANGNSLIIYGLVFDFATGLLKKICEETGGNE